MVAISKEKEIKEIKNMGKSLLAFLISCPIPLILGGKEIKILGVFFSFHLLSFPIKDLLFSFTKHKKVYFYLSFHFHPNPSYQTKPKYCPHIIPGSSRQELQNPTARPDYFAKFIVPFPLSRWSLKGKHCLPNPCIRV